MDSVLFYALLASIATTTNAELWNIIKKRSTSDVIINGIEIYSMKIDSKVTSRFAHNVITSRAVNHASVSKEVVFDVELPKTAFITNFSMTIDGITYLGNIKEKEAAKKQYEKAASHGHTAGLVKASGRKTEKFTVSVNIAAASKVTFELTYEELLKRHLGKYEMLIKVKPKQLVKQFQIEVNIFEPQGIGELEAFGSFISNDLTQTIEKSFSGKKGHVSFKPTIDQQRTCENCSTSFLDGDFTIKYDVKRDSPGNLQTKEALLKILDDVKENDHFNFILFNNRIISWKEYLVKATLDNLKEAQKFVKSIKATGSTNINDALIRTAEMMNEAHKEKVLPERSSSTIIMLTDGNPTSGELNQGQIQENVKNAIQGRYSLYNLAFGYDIDYNFLEKMALENNGLTRRIYEDSDSALQLQSFYDEVATPMLREVLLHYPINATAELTQNNFNHYYDGSEIVVAGHIIDNHLNSFTADVKAQGANKDVTFTEQVDIEETAKALQHQEYIFGDYTERLWAYLTIQQLLEKRISAQEEKWRNLAAEALELSLKYKFVMPLTSMVVTKPENNEDKAAIADKPVEDTIRYSYPSKANSVDGDPHFLIEVPQKKDHLCFNINLDPGVVLNLVKDPDTGITVNGQLIGKKKVRNNAQIQKTYIGKLGIVNTQLDLKIKITTEKITLQNGRKTATFTWLDTITLQQESLTMEINREKNLVLSFADDATFFVVLHRVWKKHPIHHDFLGLYMLDNYKVSEHTHGLLGQFFQHIDFEVFDICPGSDPKKPHATMIVKNNKLTVTRISEKDYGKDLSHGTIVPCWFIYNNGTGLIDGAHTDYIVSNLFSTPFIN
ncbi:inter-alpha-trypsin inhibitor heavy chain H3-like [Gopherus flavomarginatus]|uniref:inter-alpha-trypsin inhibitor heavy chain H3-like n=1 Tax=Gopherus flavomarginatus TaxID=286002 RepID=UPI0021CC3691|nr:inter-alpha-trypsin inhibitor heavy chain H3-like [Gopherus flavomarginatus]